MDRFNHRFNHRLNHRSSRLRSDCDRFDRWSSDKPRSITTDLITDQTGPHFLVYAHTQGVWSVVWSVSPFRSERLITWHTSRARIIPKWEGRNVWTTLPPFLSLVLSLASFLHVIKPHFERGIPIKPPERVHKRENGPVWSVIRSVSFMRRWGSV